MIVLRPNYQAFGDFGDEVDDAKAQLLAINDALYASLKRGAWFPGQWEAAKFQIDNWNTTAAGWMTLAGQRDPARVDELRRLGLKLVSTAGDIAQFISDEQLTAVALKMAQDFPTALEASANAILAGAGRVGVNAVDAAGNMLDAALRRTRSVATSAAWGTTEILLILGAGVVATIYGLRKAGLKFNIMGFQIG